MELIAQISALVVLLASVIGLFIKLKSIDANLADMVNRKISSREKIRKDLEDQQKNSDKELAETETKLENVKLDQLWKKIDSIDTQLNGNAQYKVEGLVITIEKLKMVIKNLGGSIDHD